MIPPCAVWHLLIQINHLHPSSFLFPTRIMLYMLYHHPITSVSHTQQHTVSIIHILLPLERKYKQRKIQPHNHHLFILRKKKRQSLLFVFVFCFHHTCCLISLFMHLPSISRAHSDLFSNTSRNKSCIAYLVFLQHVSLT